MQFAAMPSFRHAFACNTRINEQRKQSVSDMHLRQLSTGTSWESNNSNAVSSDDDGDVVVHTPPKSSSRPRMNNGLHSNSRQERCFTVV